MTDAYVDVHARRKDFAATIVEENATCSVSKLWFARNMNGQRWLMAGLNVIGGIAVLGSYVHGISTQADPNLAWGGVPEGLKPLYTISMFAAAIGYLVFTYYVFFRVDAERARIAGVAAYPLFNALYVAVLLPSALWMPLTFAMIEAPSAALWLAVRVDLAVVGLAALGFIFAFMRLQPVPTKGWRIALVVSAIAFANQTTFLDAIVWPAFFPV